MAVFAIGTAAVVGIFIRTGGVAGDNIRRTTAANLVNQTLETARGQTAAQIPNGRVVTTTTVGDIPYTIVQDANYLTSNATVNVCRSSGSSLAYKLVRVSVTWTNMGQVQPVTGDVLRAVGIGPTDGTKGTLAVLVTGATGLPVSGVTTTLTGTTTSQVTGSDGCVVFAGLTDGSYSVSVGQTGYVGTANAVAARSQTVGVATGVVTRSTLLYDTERTINFALNSPVTGAVQPTGLLVRIGNTYLSETTVGAVCTGSSTSVCRTGIPGQILHLFPETYVIKMGSCSGTDVSQALLDNRLAVNNNATVTIPMGALTVRLKNLLGADLAGRTVTITPASTTTCPGGDSYTTTSVSGGSTVVLPYGTWNVTTTGLTVPQQITVNSTSRTATATLSGLA